MILENQVVSLELAKKLKELGVKQESLFYWVIPAWAGMTKLEYKHPEAGYKCCLSAFTVAELGEMLPEKTNWRGYANYGGEWKMEFGDFKVSAKTEADMKAKMLIHLIENNLIQL